VKIKDELPEGRLTFAVDLEDEEETPLVAGDTFQKVKDAGLTKCVVYFTPKGYKVSAVRVQTT
jgi:hypothetical protein